jgi:hypothetical protein
MEHNLNPFRDDVLESESPQDANGEDARQRLKEFFASNMSARPRQKPKNLIILELEAVEKGLLGSFNPNYPKSMPFLSKLARESLLVTNISNEKYTTWSVASLFAIHCGLPLLFKAEKNGNKASFHLIREHKCLGDFLWLAGYNLYSYMTAIFMAHFKKSLLMHGWDARDQRNHNIEWDWDMLRHFEKSVIPMLERAPTPWAWHWANSDTHGFPAHRRDARCKDRVPEYGPILQSFDCLDQHIERFFAMIQKSSIWNDDLEIFVYGDHLLMRGSAARLDLPEPRSMVAIMPRRPPGNITKGSSIYDFTHTIFDLGGVDYSPKFPFGESMLSDKRGPVPNDGAFRAIYRNFQNGRSSGWAGSVCRVNQANLSESSFCWNAANNSKDDE